MDEEKLKIDVKDESSDEEVIAEPEKKTAFDGPMATCGEDLTDRAINDITRSEIDENIRSEDERVIEAISKKPTLKEKFLSWFHSWWDIPKKRYTVLGVGSAFLLFLMILPVTRYAFLNTVGFRGSASISVIDESTAQPLKNVDVTIRGQTVQTDINGNANFTRVKLGSTEVIVKKIAYAEIKSKQTIGFGSNDLEQAKLQPIGSQFTFEMKDWLSDLPVGKAEVVFDESSALADESGKATLTIEPTEETEIEVTITAEDYREQKFKVTTTSTESNKVSLKAGQANYFISKRSGKFDMYKMYADEEPTMIVAATGMERDDMRLSISPDKKYGVLVATREDVRNGDGFLLSGLYKVDLESSELTKLDESEQIDLVGWVDNKLAYVKIASGASGKNPNRHRLQILDLESSYNQEIAATNYFNDVVVSNNQILYAPSDAYKDNPDIALFKSDADGNVSKVYDGEVWSIIQTGKNELNFDATGDWYSYSIDQATAQAIGGPPTTRTSKVFVQRDDISLWVDKRDGKGVLLKNDGSNEDKVLWTQSGLSLPVQWLNKKHVVFRVSTEDETADYIINIEGGDAKKLTDVADVSGTDRWYYY